ncbi:MAG: FAD-dependent oxidoreductase, partial [Myxococcota bacterium]
MTPPTQVPLPLESARRGPDSLAGTPSSHLDAAKRALAEVRPACFWLDRPLRPEAREALAGDTEADLVIVGGGFTGLWAALLALEENPGRDVLLLEASRIGEGASGRNGGFADPSLTHGVLNGLEHFPEEIETLEALGRSNFSELLAGLERHGIDARYEDGGKLEVALGEDWLPELREYQETLERFGESSEWLDRDAVRAEVHSPTYEAAVFHPGGGGVLDPARLCWGLAAAVRGLGARVHEGTPVTKLRREGDCVALSTPGGRVRARKVLFATNAFRAPLFSMRRAVIPVWDYVLMTEPLSAEQRRAIGWERRQGIGDTTNQFHYYRLTDDDRILWGGYDAIYYYGGSTESRRQQYAPTFEKLAQHFFQTFPQLEGLRFSHSW